MELQGRDLRLGDEGVDVSLLLKELQLLGFDITEIEIKNKHFGENTNKAVLLFQRRHELNTTGIVDNETAHRINAEVDAGRPERFVVEGEVIHEHGEPLPKVIVKAYDKDLRKEQMLGESVLDGEGNYLITYSTDQFRKAEKNNADLIARVFNESGLLLAESDTLFNAPDKATINLAVEPREEPKLTEYEKLVSDLTPLLEDQGTSFGGLTKEDIVFLHKDTGNDETYIGFLAESARLSQRTNIPIEFFCGLAKIINMQLPLKLKSFLALEDIELAKTLSKSIENEIIPQTNLDEIQPLLDRVRMRHGISKEKEFAGKIINSVTDEPLVHLTVLA